MRLIKNIIFMCLLITFLASGVATGQALTEFTKNLSGLSKSFEYRVFPVSKFTNTAINTLEDDLLAQSAVEKISPSVVTIFGLKNPGTLKEEWLEQLFAQSKKETQLRSNSRSTRITSGTGFFIDSDGYILTNKHVVDDEESHYVVTLEDGTQKDAEVVYKDTEDDLAVVKISGENFPSLTLGDSSQLKVGQAIIGIGNSFGSFKNVTQGSISSLRRIIVAESNGEREVSRVIQSSMQLYPGDSGGPLFDLEGKVVGVNVAVAVDRENTSFSVPINNAKDFLEKLI
jgi:serine protease Do